MAGDLTLKKKKKPSSMEAAKKSQQPPTPTLPHATKSRKRRNPLSDLTNDLTSSEGSPFSPATSNPRVEAAGEEDVPGTSFNQIGLHSVPSCDVPSSSGVSILSIIHARREAAPTRKSKGTEVAGSSTNSRNRRSDKVRVDLTSDITSSKQGPFLLSRDTPQVKAIDGHAPGTSFDLLGLDAMPSPDVLSSSGCDVKFQMICRGAVMTTNGEGKEIPASSTSSHNRRSSRIRKRPGEVEDRAVSKSCRILSRKIRKKTSSEVGDSATSESCTLPNKWKWWHHLPTNTDEARKSLQEFIRQQKSYFAELDAFELPEEEASNDESE